MDNSRLKLEFNGQKKSSMSQWQVNSFTDDIMTTYYKSSILLELDEYLKKNPNTVVAVMSSSLRFTTQYKKLKSGLFDLNSNKWIQELFYLGSPIPQKTNVQVDLIYALFECVREINAFASRRKLNRIKSDSLGSIFRRVVVDEYSTISENELMEVLLSEMNNENAIVKDYVEKYELNLRKLLKRIAPRNFRNPSLQFKCNTLTTRPKRP